MKYLLLLSTFCLIICCGQRSKKSPESSVELRGAELLDGKVMRIDSGSFEFIVQDSMEDVVSIDGTGKMVVKDSLRAIKTLLNMVKRNMEHPTVIIFRHNIPAHYDTARYYGGDTLRSIIVEKDPDIREL
jgi:hypothetical protein